MKKREKGDFCLITSQILFCLADDWKRTKIHAPDDKFWTFLLFRMRSELARRKENCKYKSKNHWEKKISSMNLNLCLLLPPPSSLSYPLTYLNIFAFCHYKILSCQKWPCSLRLSPPLLRDEMRNVVKFCHYQLCGNNTMKSEI